MSEMMKTVFDWEHFAVYLSGAIDFTSDGGSGWRDEWTKKLINIGIKSQQIYNPCRKPLNGAQFNLDNEQELGREFRKNGEWDKLDDILGQIMHVDLRLVDKSDLILVNFPRIGNFKKLQKVCDGMKYHFDPAYAKMAFAILKDYANMRIPTYGTIHEIVIAHQQKKPIFLVWEGTGKVDCSAWLMRLVGHTHVFANIDTLIEHLESISHGKIAFNANEWLLLNPK